MMADNNIVYQARLHWVLFAWPIVLLCLSTYLGLKFQQLHPVAHLLMGFSLIWLVMVWMTYHFSLLTIKKSQVILCTGFWVRQTIDIPLAKIESIDIRQSILGSVFHYGLLVITGTGGSRQMVNFLSRPLTCRRYIEQLLHG